MLSLGEENLPGVQLVPVLTLEPNVVLDLLRAIKTESVDLLLLMNYLERMWSLISFRVLPT